MITRQVRPAGQGVKAPSLKMRHINKAMGRSLLTQEEIASTRIRTRKENNTSQRQPHSFDDPHHTSDPMTHVLGPAVFGVIVATSAAVLSALT